MKALTTSVVLCSAWLVMVAISDSGKPQAPPQSAESAHTGSGATRAAEGEYEVYEEGSGGAVGPFGEEVYEFHESWTLLREPEGGYRVEGERRFKTGKTKEPVQARFAVQLSRDLTVLSVTEFSKLKWIADSGPLTCHFLSTEMRCSAGGKKAEASKTWRFDVQHPYGFLWPISPFSLGSVARESERDTEIVTRVSLISIEQPSSQSPVSPLILTGRLRYLGVEAVTAAGRSWDAYKFSIKVPLHPKFLVWTSKKGLLLALAVEHQHADWPKEGLRLVRFQAFSDF